MIARLRKDSLRVTDDDRALRRGAIDRLPARPVRGTHGTGASVESARVLAGLAGKTLVLTGALDAAPLRGCDAAFHVGCAVAAVP